MEWIEKYIGFWNSQDVEGIRGLFAPEYLYIDAPFEGGVPVYGPLESVPPEKNAQMQLRFFISEGNQYVARVLYYERGKAWSDDGKKYKVVWRLWSKIMIYRLKHGKCEYLYEMKEPKTWCLEDDQDTKMRPGNIPDYF